MLFLFLIWYKCMSITFYFMSILFIVFNTSFLNVNDDLSISVQLLVKNIKIVEIICILIT